MALNVPGKTDTEAHHGPHVASLRLYIGIFVALILLTVITVGASYVDFGAANTVIAVLIASIKALLVALFFMHLRHDKTFNSIVFLSGLLFLSFLFLFTLSDTTTRGDVDEAQGHVVEQPAAASASAASPAASAPSNHEK